MAGKTVLLIVANGSEDIETVATMDVLRRAGVTVLLAGLEGADLVTCSNGTNIKPDTSLTEASNTKYGAIILPGGLKGAKSMAASAAVGKILKEHEKEGKIIAAICAAPTVLKAHGVCVGKQVTSYPSMADEMKKDYKYLEDKVVVDGNLITSRGPATSMLFGLKIAEKLVGEEKAKQVANGMLVTI